MVQSEYACHQCGQAYTSPEEFGRFTAWETLEPGSVVPAGSCPSCDGAVYPVKEQAPVPIVDFSAHVQDNEAELRELCFELAQWKGMTETGKRRIWEIENELLRRLEEKGAEALPVPGFKLGRKRDAPVYNREQLAEELKRFRDSGDIPPDEFDKAIVLPHRRELPVPITHEDVPLHVDMTRVKPLAKFGQAIREVIDANTTLGKWRLVFAVKPESEPVPEPRPDNLVRFPGTEEVPDEVPF